MTKRTAICRTFVWSALFVDFHCYSDILTALSQPAIYYDADIYLDCRPLPNMAYSSHTAPSKDIRRQRVGRYPAPTYIADG